MFDFLSGVNPLSVVMKIIAWFVLILVAVTYLLAGAILYTSSLALARYADKAKDEYDKSGYVSEAFIENMKELAIDSIKDDTLPSGEGASASSFVIEWKGKDLPKSIDKSQMQNWSGMLVYGDAQINAQAGDMKLDWGKPGSIILYRKVRVPNFLPPYHKDVLLTQKRSVINRGYFHIDESGKYGYLGK